MNALLTLCPSSAKAEESLKCFGGSRLQNMTIVYLIEHFIVTIYRLAIIGMSVTATVSTGVHLRNTPPDFTKFIVRVDVAVVRSFSSSL